MLHHGSASDTSAENIRGKWGNRKKGKGIGKEREKGREGGKREEGVKGREEREGMSGFSYNITL